MASWKKYFLLPLIFLSLTGCLGLPEQAESDELTPETAAEDSAATDSAESAATDEFSEFEDSGSESTADSAPAPEAQTLAEEAAAEPAPAPETVQEDNQPVAEENDEFAEFEQKESQELAQAASAETEIDLSTTTPEPSIEVAEPPAPTTTSKIDEIDPFVTPDPVTVAKSQTQAIATIKINSIQYKANDSGGAILIQADGPIQFTTRNNPQTEQFIVEIPGAQLPDRLKRPFNMRDIRGAFGSLDPYQEKNSNVARFVVQLRPNISDPFVTVEGNTLIIAADRNQASLALSKKSEASGTIAGSKDDFSNSPEKILTSRTLQEFLAENSKFYGKKISIETNTMSVRDALRFISEEGGVNMVIADNVSGNVSLKLRDIHWDQAFVIIMKSRNLGYIRQGNVLRIATLEDLRKEEEETIKLATGRIKIEPLVVKVFPINYAKVDDMATRLKEFLTERGKAIGDSRTSSIVVTDIEESLKRVEQLIQNLDTQPPQVLIEGRIIEATDSFQRQIGINWGFTGRDINVGKSSQGAVTLRPSLNIDNGTAPNNSFSFQMGTLDIFGQINAALTLAEVENKIRILSSPRIVTLSNEKATISQKIERPYTTATFLPNGQTGQPQVSFKTLELLLDVTPQITSDASVIMNIIVKRDLVGERVGDQVSVESREARTKVMVKNGQTSVIGGVYQNDSNDRETGVPWLKDVPVLGSLFKYKEIDNRRTELMIFLTPRIVSAGSDSLGKTAAAE